MPSSLLNARIESILTLAVGAFSVMVIAVGTLGLARSFDPTPQATVVEAAPLERVVITSQRAHAASTLTASAK
jgi:hypothetical protein